ncbi:MAG: PVC-type heme-binding CxxCH protein [Planctomycetota bacterium]
MEILKTRALVGCVLGIASGLALAQDAARPGTVQTKAFAPHTFTIPEGYELQLAVPPSLVPRPIHMFFDPQGTLYVTDSSGDTRKAPVQVAEPSHRILRLVDTDGDGVFDESTVFAEEVPFPEGILWYEGAIYVGAPPYIWKFKDTDGDHVADVREPWFDGGSVDGCGNDMHGPYLGPDGWFYWTKGGFQEQNFVLGNGLKHTSSAAHMFRAKPDGSELEVIMTGGMNNPVGVAFSPAGERFLSGTFFDLSQPGRRDGVLHAVYGGMFGRKNDRVLAQRPHTGGLLPILKHTGPSAPSGMIMAQSDALGMKGDLLCTDFNLRRVARYRLKRNGASYATTLGTSLEIEAANDNPLVGKRYTQRQDGASYASELDSLVESDQADFHPTDVIEDADGSLLIADTGSWYMVCCPRSVVAKPDILGAIYRLRKKDAPAVDDPRGLELDWSRPRVEWLGDARPYVARHAIDALAKENNIDALLGAEARIPALWALHRVPGPAARQAVRTFFNDPDAQVRSAAIYSAGLHRDAAAAPALIERLVSEEDHVRRRAAMALGRIGDRRAVGPLLDAGAGIDDPFRRHAITYALYEIGDRQSLPAGHSVAEQVRRMHETANSKLKIEALPEIKLAEVAEHDHEAEAQQGARLDALAAYLPKGDAKRGEKLYADATKSLCVTCHVKGDRGVEFGPDLTKIGAIRSERDLLEAIGYPNASLARFYEMVIVSTGDGVHAGIRVKDTVDEMVLAPAPGAEVAIPLRDIKEAQYSNISLMPTVFDALLKPEEIADIVAYLKTAK